MKVEKILDRIEILQKNPLLAGELIGPKGLPKDFKSNCHGTTLFLWGIGCPNKLIGNEEVFSFNVKGRPGYVGGKTMEELLADRFRFVRDTSPSILAIWEKVEGEYWLMHSGIYLGIQSGIACAFHQPDYGLPFSFFNLNITRRRAFERKEEWQYSFHVPGGKS